MTTSRCALLLLGLILSAACSEDQHQDPPSQAEPGQGSDSTAVGTVSATIDGLRSNEGQVLARLYRGAEGFPGDQEKALLTVTAEILSGAASVTFADVPHGEFALWICHDEDSNGELKTNFLGMPKEGVGVSGPPESGMPSYRAARFSLAGDSSEHSIKVKYL